MRNYFAWIDTGELVPLGPHEDFSSASEEEPPNTHWLFSEHELVSFHRQITLSLLPLGYKVEDLK